MKKYINVIYFIILLGLSVLFHFLYQWSNNNYIVGFFTPINESIWEHLKLLYYPGLLVLIIHIIINKGNKKIFIGYTLGLILSLISIIILYYTYSGIIGMNIDFVNIIIMIISIILYLYLGSFFSKLYIDNYYLSAIILNILFILMFIIFTIKVPNINLFKG